jgi:hypothetical protein
MNQMHDHFWVVDVEGNGASPPEIIELAMVEIRSRMVERGRHLSKICRTFVEFCQTLGKIIEH